MNPIGELALGQPLACLADVSDRSWALLGLGELSDGSCYIADTSGANREAEASNPPGASGVRVVAFFDGATGDVFPCADGTAEPQCEDGPAVHVIGELDGATGQVTVRQEKGNYLRICRWDRVDSNAPLLQGALLRTLPQCGCGGSLGTPKLFSSFAEMGAYHFCAFYL